MPIKRIFMTAAAILAIGTIVAEAQPAMPPPGNDPYGYYSQYDRDGYYDRDGRYRRIRHRDFDGPPPPPAYGPPPPPPGGVYYEQGRYEADCHRGNAAAGTIFGALAGGLIGGAASHGNGGAVVGGAILGGLLGNTVSRDIECDDQPYAFRVYADGLNGNLGQRYEWRNGRAYGYFTPMREFRRGGVICRDFSETSYRSDGRSFSRTGTACREVDGNWRFD
jgi:surface antigen